MKKDSFLNTGETWLMKTCTRERAGYLDTAPFVNGDRHLVECLIAAANGYQLTFGAPNKRAMNGEITLVNGHLRLNTQDGVDKVLNTPIINDGSNGKLAVLITSIEERSKLNPMLHNRSSRNDKEEFMAAKHITLNGKNTSNQSMGLENMIHRMQMPLYDKGLASRTTKKHSADSSKGGKKAYPKTLGRFTHEQYSANGKLGGTKAYPKTLGRFTHKQKSANGKKGGTKVGDKRSCFDQLNIPPTDELHDIASGDTVHHGKHGKGTVKTVQKPGKKGGGRAMVRFENKPGKLTDAGIGSLVCNKKRCRFEKEYKRPLKTDARNRKLREQLQNLTPEEHATKKRIAREKAAAKRAKKN